MPPKATDTAVAEATKDIAFLAMCFMNMKSKPVVDSAAVAEKLSMSVGGVRNKLRPIIKAMEDAGALWTTDQAATPNRSGGTKSALKTAENDAGNEVGVEEGNGPVTPTPKAKGRAKSSVKTPSSSTKRGRKAKGSDIDGHETTKENPTLNKRAKVTSHTITAEPDEVKAEVKTEHDGGNEAHEELEDLIKVNGAV